MSPIKAIYSIPEMRAEIERLGNLLMRCNMKFLLREQQLIDKHKGDPNLPRVLETDKVLANHSGAAKSVSTLLAGLKAALDAREGR